MKKGTLIKTLETCGAHDEDSDNILRCVNKNLIGIVLEEKPFFDLTYGNEFVEVYLFKNQEKLKLLRKGIVKIN